LFFLLWQWLVPELDQTDLNTVTIVLFAVARACHCHGKSPNSPCIEISPGGD